PGQVSGPSGVPSDGDSEQPIRDTLARLEAKIDRLAEQLADAEAEAEEIVRRAASPRPARHTAAKRTRRRDAPVDRWLRAVKVALIAILGLGVVVAFMAPQRMQRQRFTPLPAVQVSHHSPRKTPG